MEENTFYGEVTTVMEELLEKFRSYEGSLESVHEYHYLFELADQIRYEVDELEP